MSCSPGLASLFAVRVFFFLSNSLWEERGGHQSRLSYTSVRLLPAQKFLRVIVHRIGGTARHWGVLLRFVFSVRVVLGAVFSVHVDSFVVLLGRKFCDLWYIT